MNLESNRTRQFYSCLQQEDCGPIKYFLNKEYQRLNIFEKKIIKQKLTHDIIPELSYNKEANKLRLAICLCFINSKKLDDNTRRRLEIEEHVFDMPRRKCPQLLTPTRVSEWVWQCSLSEGYLEESVYRAEGLYNDQPSFKTVAHEWLGCLAGKTYARYSGLCFKTTEFPNGALFLSDVWYSVGDQNSVRRIKNLSEKANALNNDDIYHDVETNAVIINNMVVWPNMGGKWQPTRGLNENPYKLNYQT